MKLVLIIVVFLLLAVSAAAEQYAPDQLIVKYKSTEYLAASENLFQEKELSGIAIVKLPKGADVIKAAKEYRKMPTVEYAEPNYILTTFIVPNDASYSQQLDEYAAIALETAWNITTGSRDVIIAIIDTGVDWDHPDLAANIWNNTDEIANNSIDDDGNGYVDDVRGYDFVSSPSDCDAGDDCSTIDNNPIDYHGHGTHVAGIAAAVTNNSLGVSGTCWNCTIMPVRAGFKNSGGLGELETADAALAIVYAANNSADIISMSFGGGNTSLALQEAIEFAASKGSILVAAAGNGNAQTKIYPAAYADVISVAGTDNSDARYSNSQYGSWVDIAAPAVSIYSTYFNDTYTTLSGTSMAAPMVSGVIGLLKSYNRSLNSSQVLQILNSTGKILENFGLAGLNLTRINATAALLQLQPPLPNATILVPQNSNISGSFLINSSVNSTDAVLSANASILNSTGIAASLQLSIGAGTNLSGYWNSTFNTSVLPDGNYNISINVTNILNLSRVSESVSIVVDNTLPNASIISPANGSTANGIILINSSVNDSLSQVMNVTFKISNNATSTEWLSASMILGSDIGFWNSSLSAAALQDGTYNITINATDFSGNSFVENSTQIIINRTISACQDLSSENKIYLLQGNISGNSTCISISAGNITLDCLGYTISYGSNSSGYGVYTQSNSTRIQNCIINKSGSAGSGNYGIYLNNSNNSEIINNSLSTNGNISNHGIYSNNSIYINISLNSINSNSTASYGIFFERSLNSNITENNLTTVGNSSSGIVIFDSNSTIASSNIIRTEGNLSFAVSLSGSNNTLYNNIFNTTEKQVNVSSAANNFSTTLIAGTNIIGYSYIGGNYYDNSTVGGLQGFTCSDSDRNGICDSSYELAENVTDFYPLTIPSPAPVQDDPPSSSGGSSSGGGGGIPLAPSNSVAHYYSSLEAGQATEMKISKASIALTRIAFSPKSDVSALSIFVKEVKQEEIPVPIQNSFQYIQISASKEITAPAVIEFAVNSSWLSENSFTASSVSLNRLVDSRWVKLETKLESQDGLKYYYSAESPGFSYFVITAEKAVANITVPVAPLVQNVTVPELIVAQAQPELKLDETSGKPLEVFVASFFLAFLFFAALFFRHHKKRRRHLHTHRHKK